MNDMLSWDREAVLMENESSRIDTAISMMKLGYNQSIRDAEVTVFKENGSYDDLEDLYTEAVKKRAEVKKGIISRIAQWFENTLRKLLDKITSFLTGSRKKNQNELVEYDTRIDEIAKDGKGILGRIKSLISNFTKTGVGKLAIFAGGIFLKTYIKRKVVKLARRAADAKVSDAKNIWNGIKQGAIDLCNKVMEDPKKEDNNENDDDLTFLQKLKKWAGDRVIDILRFIADVFGLRKENKAMQNEENNNGSDTPKDNSGDNKEPTNTDNGGNDTSTDDKGDDKK